MRREGFRLLFFAIVLGWFTALGCYIGNLRSKLKRSNEELAVALREAEALAWRDPLTGCYNRRYAMEQIELETKRAARGVRLSVCLADLDEFKAINDALGHGAGDDILRRFVDTVSKLLRPTGFVARFGGEEFLLVLSQAAAADAARVAERIRRAVAEAETPFPDGRRITVSIGVAEHRTPEPIDDTLARADRALYQAKRDGRDRVVLAP